MGTAPLFVPTNKTLVFIRNWNCNKTWESCFWLQTPINLWGFCSKKLAFVFPGEYVSCHHLPPNLAIWLPASLPPPPLLCSHFSSLRLHSMVILPIKALSLLEAPKRLGRPWPTLSQMWCKGQKCITEPKMWESYTFTSRGWRCGGILAPARTSRDFRPRNSTSLLRVKLAGTWGRRRRVTRWQAQLRSSLRRGSTSSCFHFEQNFSALIPVLSRSKACYIT